MLRIQDNCILVDNGFIEAMTTCPWKAKTAFLTQRRSAGESSALRFGKHMHTVLAYRNKMECFGAKWTEAKQLEILTNRFMATPCEHEGWRNLNSAMLVVRGYNRDSFFNNPTHKILRHPKTNLPLVEQPFAIDTGATIQGHRLIYIGRIDRVAELPDGIFVRDYKTTSMLGDNTWSEAQMSEQLRGYCWAVKKTTGIEPVGYCYDVLACRDSIENAVWDDLLEKVVAGKTASGKPSKAVPLTFDSQRFFTKEPSGQLDEWFENMVHQVETFMWHFSRGLFPRHHKHCRNQYGLCEFFQVCSLPEHSRESCLNSTMFKTNEWSPLYTNK